MKNTVSLKPVGLVTQTLVDSGEIIRQGHNLVVDSSVEILMQCLMFGPSAGISSIVFGNTGSPVPGVAPLLSPGMTSVSTASGGAVSPVNQFADTQSYISDDPEGLASIGTFTTIYTSTSVTPFTYDTLGLTNAAGSLFSVWSFLPVTLTTNQSVAVQWTILLNGNS